jgi:modulator of FtsH protease HflC
MSSRTAGILVALIVAAYALVSTCVMIVTEYEQVVLTEFGKPVGEARTNAGIYFVLPWYQRHRFSKRLLRWDGERSEIPTRDKRFIWVDTTARWQIVDPLKFLVSVRDYAGAQTRLDDIIDSGVRSIISGNDLIEAVRTDKELVTLPGEITATNVHMRIKQGRKKLQHAILLAAKATTVKEYGIELVDVRVKRINYIEDVQRSIFNRMIAERKKVAAQYRSEGKGKAAQILGRMERQLKQIRSGAYRSAKEIEGEADATATRIYADAYGKDAEFYGFMQSLETWPAVIGNRRRKGTKTSLILSTDSDLFRYLNESTRPPASSNSAK